jgi:hypothetical protein
MPRPSHSSRFYHPSNIWLGIQISKLLILYISHSSVTSPFLGPNIPSAPYSQTPSAYVPPSVSDKVSHPYKTAGKIIVLYTLIFIPLDSKLEDKDSAPNDNKHSLTSICS